MPVVLPAPGGACNTAQALSARVLCNRSSTVATGRPIHGKLSKLFYFPDMDSFDSDKSAMYINAKKQVDLQGYLNHLPAAPLQKNAYDANNFCRTCRVEANMRR